MPTFGTRDHGTIIAEPAGTSWDLRGLDLDEDSLEDPFALHPPWNLVTAAQSGPVSELVGGVPGVLAVFRWDPAARLFESWRPALPASLNSLGAVEAGDVLWLRVAASATWPRGVFVGDRDLTLLAGWNTVGWTGQDATAAAVALLLGATRLVAFAPDTQRFQIFDPLIPEALNSLFAVPTGTGLWVLLASPATVTIPATQEPPALPPEEADVVIRITALFFDGLEPRAEGDEYVEFRNEGAGAVDLSGWQFVSLVGDQRFTFPVGSQIAAGQTCRVYTDEIHPEWCGFSFASGVAVWRNSGDAAELRDAAGTVIDGFAY